ncbi:hypothetical protein DCE93_08640 [Agromyces badenianii]|uniref:Uncharacterized protein n=1 Tax=Agromyces badenianii TaxID=2080742 RepID=A0A2S0WWK4_9MICO|nr:hypothetical protein [Agromyces badenianii]AWB95723.1 hypothetical protein DCE93_08640 [Agromyces badenianii]PWC03986.1 hypothetical protein DCE94_07315 [Agromyces badenianii]
MSAIATIDPHTRTREPYPIDIPGLSISPAAPGLWRVTRPKGPVLGHIERRGAGEEARFGAKRLAPGGIRSIDLGEFWSSRDAAEVFR